MESKSLNKDEIDAEFKAQLKTVSADDEAPKPEEMYDEKMMELLDERDDLKIKLQELEKEKEKIETLYQTLQLEVSGIQVENENLKQSLAAETKRADDAVKLAEKAVATMKKRRR